MDRTTKAILKTVIFGVVLYAGLTHFNRLLTAGKALVRLLAPLISSLVIAFVLHIPVNLITGWLEKLFRKAKRKPSHRLLEIISLILTLCIAALVVFLVCIVTLPHLARSFRSLYEQLSRGIPQWIQALENAEWFNSLGLSSWLESFDYQHLLEPLQNINLLNYALDVSTSVVAWIVAAGVVIVLAVYVLLSKKAICLSAKRITYAVLPRKAADWMCYFSKLVNESFSKFFTGQLLESCILGLLMFASLSLFGVPYAGITAVLSAISAFVPYIGAALSCAIGAFLTILVSPDKVITCILVYMVTQFVENQFIYPHVVGNSVGLPPILTLIAVIIGERISGLVGMVFAIPMMAVLYTLVSEGVQKSLRCRGIEGLE